MIGRFQRRRSTAARLLQSPDGFAWGLGLVAGPADLPDGDRDPGRPASGRAGVDARVAQARNQTTTRSQRRRVLLVLRGRPAAAGTEGTQS